MDIRPKEQERSNLELFCCIKHSTIVFFRENAAVITVVILNSSMECFYEFRKMYFAL